MPIPAVEQHAAMSDSEPRPHNPASDFFHHLPAIDHFDRVVDPDAYRPLPGDWWLAVADVVGSTKAIAAGRYKAVNFAGAAPIAALINALQTRDLLFVFGGDGMVVAIPPEGRAAAAEALAATAKWSRAELDLELRVGLVAVAAIHAAGREVAVARYQASPHIEYAMLDGGGADWAEAELKAGRLAALAAPEDARPDLTGLSCRWQPLASRRGLILSVIAEVPPGAPAGPARRVLHDLLDKVAALSREGHPVPSDGPGFRWPPPAIAVDLEARTGTPDDGDLRRRRRKIRIITAIARLLEICNLRLAGFDARHYRRTTGENVDFRKFQDGLLLTLDVSPAEAEALEAMLAAAAAQGLLRYGTHRQAAAMMTCIVPSALEDDHMHFVDGADGGYARAATALKQARAG